MLRCSTLYFIYGALILCAGLVYAVFINGPSRLLILAFGIIILVQGILTRRKDNDGSLRDSLTLIGSLSPGAAHIFYIYPQTKDVRDAYTGIALMLFCFGSLAVMICIGVLGLTGYVNYESPVLPTTLFVESMILVLGTYQYSLLSVNKYCEDMGMPYTAGRFEYSTDVTWEAELKHSRRKFTILVLAVLIIGVCSSFFF